MSPQTEKDKISNLFDKMRVFDQTESTPKRVVNGSSMPFQLGGETSVNDGTTSGILNQIIQRCLLLLDVAHFSLSLSLVVEDLRTVVVVASETGAL